mmetsp:Transcript_28971/g.26318  ORF Transcript_28971/g.26318 Transcript_28971/m.26318 type:complete len:181 (-) Transcript_28971:451-993(-)
MQDLESIYASLYDLFNQNFTVVSRRKNCRVALGSTNNPMCYVHDDFRCIVIIDEKDLKKLDPPFLNRFEKQKITIDSMMSPEQKDVFNNIKDIFRDATRSTTDKQFGVCLEKMAPCATDDAIGSLVMYKWEELKSVQQMTEEIMFEMIKCVSMDFILAIENSQLKDTKMALANNLTEEYF